MGIIRPLLGTIEYCKCEWMRSGVATKMSLENKKQNLEVSINDV